ncbi:hypothetical protein [Flavobacterium aquicola]|uniref:SGNH/GDSL hydrolase family protein n=1 Tax=Flavobacterium aquicola TaxID=1682742 RepID=A0A3E0EJ44_9FLAO|nr:hypothetical protein [Flavobacterium aquicola]REG98284.1 hypothetical protein C8P67_107211 [Flavobacterium aquicola]
MKKFLLFTSKILVLAIVIAILLDFIYTAVYLQSSNRGKIDQVYNSENENYDVIILGSSRANNHFVSQMFKDKGLKTFNYGMSGGHLFEADLLLKLMIERHYKIKNVILEADLNLTNEHRADGISSKFLPYLHNSKIIKEHFSTEEDFNYLYYIPFYRYIKFDPQIGVREMFFQAIHKGTSHLQNLGYHALKDGKTGNMKNNIVSLKPLNHNKYYEEIKQICKENNINFIAIMTPMCENVVGMNYFEKVQKAYPEIHNYENVVIENKYFSSCGHMNDIGAKMFTARILKDFFPPSSPSPKVRESK